MDIGDGFPSKRPKQEEVTGISRSGRVRKKSSKLMDFESPDEIDNRYKKREKETSASSGVSATPKGRKYFEKPPIKVEPSIKMEPHLDISDEDDYNDDFNIKGDNLSTDSDSELGMYGHPEGVEEDSSMDSLGSEVDDDDLDDDNSYIDERDASRSSGRKDSSENMSSQAQSLYMMEKSTKKKLVVRDGKIVGRVKAQRKDKGKTRFTAYMLWAKEIRQELTKTNPDMDFATMSKRLGELWATVPNTEKFIWKKRAKKMQMGKEELSGGIEPKPRWKIPTSRSKFINKLNSRNQSVKEKQTAPVLQLGTPSVIGNLPVSPPDPPRGAKANLVTEPVTGPGLYKVVGTQPVDVAAHLRLLGESLSIIGERLKEHEGQIAVSGSLSVLLDSLLCALGPLLCLTQELHETNGCPREMLTKILDNIAYFMPGL